MNIKRNLELLKLNSGKERAKLLREPLKVPTRKQLEILNNLSKEGGTLSAERVNYKTGLVLTARRWARLHQYKGELVFSLTEAGFNQLDPK